MKKFILSVALLTVAFLAGQAIAQSKALAAEMAQQWLLESKDRVETKKTLEPNLFSRDMYAVSAYRVAKEIPDVLDKLFCYCYCASNPRFKHKSLLTCYTDDHAAGCGICIKEALTAKTMTDKGKTPAQIASMIRDTYVKK
jgi:Pyruvate/2-oxoacid:ferredoxin oxidoreductase delta subunit